MSYAHASFTFLLFLFTNNKKNRFKFLGSFRYGFKYNWITTALEKAKVDDLYSKMTNNETKNLTTVKYDYALEIKNDLFCKKIIQ